MVFNSEKIKIEEKTYIFKLNEKTMFANGLVLGLFCKEYKNKFIKLKELLYSKIKEKHNNTVETIIKNKIKYWIINLKNKYRIIIEDIIGFSEGIGIKDDTILEINLLVEIYDHMCTLLGVKSKNKSWNLRILDLDNELTNLSQQLDIPLAILSYNYENIKYISFNFLGLFNSHTSYFNKMMITTFSWNNLHLKDFLKNDIPPLLYLRYIILSRKNINSINEFLQKSKLKYDGYVMLMNKDRIIFEDLNKERNESSYVDKNGNILISDYNFEINEDLEYFKKNLYSKIPSDLRCFSLIFDFDKEIFYFNNNLGDKIFKIVKLNNL